MERGLRKEKKAKTKIINYFFLQLFEEFMFSFFLRLCRGLWVYRSLMQSCTLRENSADTPSTFINTSEPDFEKFSTQISPTNAVFILFSLSLSLPSFRTFPFYHSTLPYSFRKASMTGKKLKQPNFSRVKGRKWHFGISSRLQKNAWHLNDRDHRS